MLHHLVKQKILPQFAFPLVVLGACDNTLAMSVTLDAKEFGRWLFNDWLPKSLEDKMFVPSRAIEKVDGGIEAVQKMLDMHKKGLSGKKLVLTLRGVETV